MTAPSVQPVPTQTIPRKWRGIVWWVGAVLSLAIALASYRYLVTSQFTPEVVASNTHRFPWMVTHVTAAATALLLGPFQFVASLRTRYRKAHRWFGRAYVALCLIGGVAGFILALGASTGPISTAGFGTLAVLWIVTTSVAWRRAVTREFVLHQAWMIRSFALTFAAVTLRLYLPLLIAFPAYFDDGYRAISFLCWVPNFVLAEMYIRNRRRAQRAALTPQVVAY